MKKICYHPANVPKANANIVLVTGSRPKVANLAKINAPNGNVPSTDKSGKSNIYML